MSGATFVYQAGNHTAQSDLPTQFFLTAGGANVAPYNHNGDYSAASVDRYYRATSRYDVHQVLVVISDNAKFVQDGYGAIAAGTIVNGPRFYVDLVGQARRYLLSGYRAVHNYDWVAMTEHVTITDFSGLAQTMTVSFDIRADYGCPLTLMPGDKIGVELNDNFSTLVSHTFGLRGQIFI